jgi:hypothetical protein
LFSHSHYSHSHCYLLSVSRHSGHRLILTFHIYTYICEVHVLCEASCTCEDACTPRQHLAIAFTFTWVLFHLSVPPVLLLYILCAWNRPVPTPCPVLIHGVPLFLRQTSCVGNAPVCPSCLLVPFPLSGSVVFLAFLTRVLNLSIHHVQLGE